MGHDLHGEARPEVGAAKERLDLGEELRGRIPLPEMQKPERCRIFQECVLFTIALQHGPYTDCLALVASVAEVF